MSGLSSGISPELADKLSAPIYFIFVGARVAPSTGKAGWSLPFSLALLAGYLFNTGIVTQQIRDRKDSDNRVILGDG